MPQCADPNAELLSAAEAGDAGAAALLLYVLDCPDGLDVNHRDRFGRTPLFLASSMGHELVVKALLNHADIDVNAESSDGSTPLVAAASNDNVKVVEMILEADAGMDGQKEMGLRSRDSASRLSLAAGASSRNLGPHILL